MTTCDCSPSTRGSPTSSPSAQPSDLGLSPNTSTNSASSNRSASPTSRWTGSSSHPRLCVPTHGRWPTRQPSVRRRIHRSGGEREGAKLAVLGLDVRFPLASRVGAASGEAQGAARDAETAYRFGLQVILDGVAARLLAVPHPPPTIRFEECPTSTPLTPRPHPRHRRPVNNLRDVSVDLPKRRLTVFTGCQDPARAPWCSARLPPNRSAWSTRPTAPSSRDSCRR